MTTTTVSTVEMRLELIHLPVSDVDRARDFYVDQCGWQLLTDHVQPGAEPTKSMRIVQICPPGSGCAILLGRNIPEISDMPVGVQKGLHLVVADMEKATTELAARGVELGEVQDLGGCLFCRFEDPDGNSWLLQQWPEGGFPHEELSGA